MSAWEIVVRIMATCVFAAIVIVLVLLAMSGMINRRDRR